MSAAVLLYEMAQVRAFAYSLPPLLAYTGISLGMAGFGIGAMILSLAPALCRANPRRSLALLAVLEAVAMVGANALFARVSWDVVLAGGDGIIALVLEILLPCTAPYVLAGLFFAVVFSAGAERIGRIYFFNMAGSGLGAVLIVLLIGPLGAQRVILLSALAAALGGALLAAPGSRAVALTGASLAVAASALLPVAPGLLPFTVDPRDAIGLGMLDAARDKQPQWTREFDEWNLVARIEVWDQPGKARLRTPETADYKVVAVDAGATTLLIEDQGRRGWGKGLFEDSIYGLAYRVKGAPKDVLVIGAGGGTDIQTALHWGARRVVGVEINSSTIRAVQGPFAHFVGWPLEQERVSLVHGDGRSYVKGTDLRFDVIQMSGVDTLTVHATGSFNMVEEYLYTINAFEDYLRALKPDGVLAVVRFGAEHLRLTAIASEALMRLGVKEPSRHVAAFKQSGAAAVLVKRAPFEVAEVESLAVAAMREAPSGVSMPPWERWGLHIDAPLSIVHLTGGTVNPMFERYFRAVAGGEAARRAQAELMSLPTDDKPYYLLSGWLSGQIRVPMQDNIVLLKAFWLGTILLALALIVAPVAILRRRLGEERPLAFVLPYFFLVGVAYMLLEIGIMNRFSIFVGSPGASTAVVLAGLLVSSGAGSFLTDRFRRGPLPALGLLVASAVLVFAVSPLAFDAAVAAGAGLFSRGLLAALLVAPLGLAMGFFFPSGLRALLGREGGERLVPWAVSVNGFASVLGSVAALPLSIFLGFKALAAIAVAAYGLAALSLALFARKAG